MAGAAPAAAAPLRFSDNTSRVRAPAGSTDGGGIWNGSSLAGPDSTLTLDPTLIAGNVLRSTADLPLRAHGRKLRLVPHARLRMSRFRVVANVTLRDPVSYLCC